MTPLQHEINAASTALLARADGLRVHASATRNGVNATALDALEWSAALRADLDELDGLLVHQARVEGATWELVGEAMNMTKQGAHQRWGS